MQGNSYDSGSRKCLLATAPWPVQPTRPWVSLPLAHLAGLQDAETEQGEPARLTGERGWLLTLGRWGELKNLLHREA